MPINQRLEKLVNGATQVTPVTLLTLVLAVCACVDAWSVANRWAGIDFYQFWVVGQAVKAGDANDIYADAERQRLGGEFWRRAQDRAKSVEARARSRQFQAARVRQVLETFSTPFLYAVFGGIGTGDYDRDQGFFQRASLVLYVLAIVMLGAMVRGPFAMTALALVFSLVWFDPLTSDVQVGNVNRLQLALLVAFLAVQRWSLRAWATVIAGAILGAAICFKPNLAFVSVVWALGWSVARQLRRVLMHIAGVALGAALAISTSSAWFGSMQPWRHWTAHLRELFQGLDLTASKGNFALAQVASETLGVHLGLLLPLALIALAVAAAWHGARGGSTATLEDARRWDLILVSLGAVVSLLAVKLAWLHYYLLVIPAVLVLLRRTSSPRMVTIVVTVLAFAMISGKWIAVLAPANDVLAAWFTGGGAVVLYALLLRELARA